MHDTVHQMRVTNQNITLVYKSIDLGRVDRNRLRQIIGDKVTLMDTPDVIIAISPPALIQIDQKRVQISAQLPDSKTPPDEYPIWKLAHDSQQLIENGNLIAYGFNYQIILKQEDVAIDELLLSYFLPDRNRIESILGDDAPINLISPKIAFMRNDLKYGLQLETNEERRDLLGHMNVHFVAQQLPDVERLEVDYSENLQYFQSILNKLVQDYRK